MATAGEGLGPGSDHAGELAGVLVVGGHVDGGLGATVLKLGGFAAVDGGRAGWLFGVGRGLDGAGIVEEFEFGTGDVEGAEASGAEEDDGVLDALAAEAGHRFLVLAENAEDATVV